MISPAARIDGDVIEKIKFVGCPFILFVVDVDRDKVLSYMSFVKTTSPDVDFYI
jgi:hypothetical protein